MRLRFIYLPVSDIVSARAFYRDELGLTEAWVDDEDGVIAFDVPGSNVQLLLEQSEGTAAPFFVVPSVAEFHERARDRVTFLEEPQPIGPGMLARFTDPSGNVIRVMDDTTSRERA